MITYIQNGKNRIQVLLDSKVVGDIHIIDSSDHFKQYQYKPKGSKIKGEKFNSLSDCKKSLE